MSQQPERLRQHPDVRFQSRQHQIDLKEVASQLMAEPLTGASCHRQETIYRHGPVPVALFLFETGARLVEHAAEGVVTIHVLEGRLKMLVEEQTHDLRAGQILMMTPRMKHDVYAEQPTRMLLTVCLEVSKADPSRE